MSNRPNNATDPLGLVTNGEGDGGGGCGILCIISISWNIYEFIQSASSGQSDPQNPGYPNSPSTPGTDPYCGTSPGQGCLNESLGLPPKIAAQLGDAGLAATIQSVFGLPGTDGCEFGACGGGGYGYAQGSGGIANPTSPVDQAAFVGGLYLIYQTFQAMEKANVKNSDKYFHCTAMASATALGPGGEAAAVTASWGREITDTFKYRAYLIIGNKHGLNFRDSIADSKEDLKADYAGINGGFNGCNQYRVRGLP